MSTEPKLETVDTHAEFKKLVEAHAKEKGLVIEGTEAVSPGVQKYIDSMASKMTPVHANPEKVRAGLTSFIGEDKDRIQAYHDNLGPTENTLFDAHVRSLHHLTDSAAVETEIRKSLKGTLAEKYLADPRYANDIKATFAHVLPKDQTVTVADVQAIAKNIEAGITPNTKPEEVVSAFKANLDAIHSAKITNLQVTETAAATSASPTPGAAPAETGYVATKKKIDGLIDANLKDEKAKKHATQLKKSFDEVFSKHPKVEFNEEAVTNAITKFSTEASKDAEEAQKLLKEGKLHETFLNDVKAAITNPHDVDATKIDEAIKGQKEVAAKVLGRNMFQRLIAVNENYGTSAISDDLKVVEGKRATGRLAMRGLGTVTGVGLIVSGFGDFKGREANDNSGQVESHPLSGIFKTVGGAGLVGISTLYKGMGRAVA